MMKRLGLLAGGLLLLGSSLFFTGRASAQDVQNFYFYSFIAEYSLSRAPDKSSKLDVVESLSAEFPATNQNHGILRALPAKYQGHTLSLKVQSVQDGQGHSYPYTTYKQNDNLVLRIGDANTYVHDSINYVISYSYQDVISFYKDHDEFFWDINGDQWPQTFRAVGGHIYIPTNLSKQLSPKSKCYIGSFGSKSTECTIDQDQDSNNDKSTTVSMAALNVGPHQSLSVVLGFKKGTFAYSQAVGRERIIQKFELFGGAVLAIAPALIALGFMFRRWRQFGDDPKGRGVIIPEYEPPKGFNSLTSDYLMKENLRQKAVAAALIESAVAKNIKIYEIPKKGLFSSKSYEVELIKLPSDSAEMTALLKSVFDGLVIGTRLNLSSSGQKARAAERYKELQRIDDSLSKNLFGLGYFIKDPKEVKKGYRTWALIFMFIAAGAIGLALWTKQIVFWGPVIGAGLSALILFIFSGIMSAKTQLGVDTYDALLGLKDYIKLAEADKLKFLQSPEGVEKDPDGFNPKSSAQKIKLFEKLLPYAILFGLEKDWAKQFENVYSQPPDWYQGNWTAFNTGYLIGSIGSFNSAASSSFSAPSSSGSGFSGGGAGGGGGGGGGGGW